MRHALVALSVLVLLLSLTGCSWQARPTLEPEKSIQALPPGAEVALENGLALTVPESWTATLTTYASPDGDLEASEYLLLENWDSTSGPKTLMVFSSQATTLPVPILSKYGRDTFTPGPANDRLQILIGQPDAPYAPKRLMAAVTHLPGASTGIMFYAGDPEDPSAALQEVLSLFSITGLDVGAG